jgi:hypothetical protein
MHTHCEHWTSPTVSGVHAVRRDTVAAPPLAIEPAPETERDPFAEVMDRLEALELVAEHRAESSNDPAVVYDAAQCALCLSSVHDTLADLHRAAVDEDAQASLRARAARVATLLRNATRANDARVDDAEEDADLDASLALLRSHLSLVLGQ